MDGDGPACFELLRGRRHDRQAVLCAFDLLEFLGRAAIKPGTSCDSTPARWPAYVRRPRRARPSAWRARRLAIVQAGHSGRQSPWPSAASAPPP
jgi:hypothetical protein